MSEGHGVIAGRYRLVERIGLGGMGAVWTARDERLQRTVAVKLLNLPAGVGDAEADVAKHRAMREARITARLHHPHAVPVFDVVEHDGQPCLVMQYLPSRTLQEVLSESGTMPADEVALIGAEVGSALAAAHAAGVVHRDVKPANILITTDGSAKITDFGISHALGDPSLTSTGMVTGTPAFLAPEVARGEPSSPASDVFSLGATLFTAVEGAPPFGTDPNPMALLHRVASDPVTPPVRAGALTPLLMAMLGDRPQDRPSMAQAAEALQRLDLDRLPGGEPTAPLAVAATEALPQRSVDRVRSSTTAVPPAVPPAAPPVVPPVVPPAGPPVRARSARGLVAVVALLALAAVAFFAWQGLVGGGDPRPAAAPVSTASGSGPASPSRTSPSSPPTRTEATSSSPARTTSRTTQQESRPAAPATGTRLAQAVRDYYALLPDGTEQGYALLTARYRRATAGSLRTYEAFWGTIQKVTVRKAVGSPPGSVEATLTYTFDDGRVVEERTAYTLVDQQGTLKIDSSKVLSSREL